MIWISALTFLITFWLVNTAQWGKFFSHLWFSVEHKKHFLTYLRFLQITYHYSTCNTFLLESSCWFLLLCSFNQSASTLMIQVRPILCFWDDFFSFLFFCVVLVFLVGLGLVLGFFCCCLICQDCLKSLGLALQLSPDGLRLEWTSWIFRCYKAGKLNFG